ncbi:hypothetical protein IWW37_003199 [Coemansia sp. RSA 2050]|nr:hypothetical protein IWW37_003199 [Coemansia sp. RSA 2050]KAJ2733139.1 hypothetical protein IW152_003296 [Coemansia sp. BCRC 34962]
MVGLAAVYTAFVVVTMAMFIIKARDKRSGLDKRKVALVTIQAVGCYLVSADGAITGAANNWSCIGKLWLFNMGFALSLMALTARAFHLLVVSKVHMISTQLAARPPVVSIPREPEFTTTESIRTNDGISVLGGLHSASSASPLVEKGSVFSHMDAQSLDVRQKCLLLPIAKSGKCQRPKAESRLRLTQQLKRYKKMLPYVSERMLVLFVTAGVLAVALATLVINLTDKQFSRHNIICVYQWGFIPGNVFVLGHFAIVYPIFLWRNWKAHDAYGIRNDLIICETVGFLCMVIMMVWMNALGHMQQILPGLAFIWIYSFFIHVSSVFFPLLRAIQHTKRTDPPDMSMFAMPPATATAPSVAMPPTSTRRANFNRMMDDPAEYQQFREFAASCFCSELTAFIDEYQALKARTLVLFERHTTRDSLAVAACHVSPPQAPGTLARGSDTADTLRGRLRDDVLLQNADSLQIRTTSITVSILETVIDTYRGESIPGMRQFPPELLVKLEMINREFVDPRSYTSVNASPLTVKRFIERMQSKDYSLTLLDEFKSEVLFMLYTDVYTRYVRH